VGNALAVYFHATRNYEKGHKKTDRMANLLNWLVYYAGLSRLLGTHHQVYLLYHRVNNCEVVARHYGKRRFVTDQQFEKQMRLLSKINDGRVSITFDDGYKDNFLYAYPILKKYGQRAIFFISSGFIDGNYFHAGDIVDCYIRKGALTKKEAKKLRMTMRELPLSQRNELIGRLEIEAAELSDDHAMTWADLKRLLVEGHIIGNHTVNHPVLTRESQQHLVYEIAKCNQDIRDHLGIECRHFAYPYGRMKDIPPRIETLLADHGIEYAFTTVRGYYSDDESPFFIRRMPISYGDDLAAFANRCYGVSIERGVERRTLVDTLLRRIGVRR